MRVLMLSVVVHAMLSGCGPRERSVSHLKIDVSIPSGQINAPDVRRMIQKFQEIQSTPNGSGLIPAEEMFSFFPLTEAEQATVRSARPQPAQVRCQNNNCMVTSVGDQVYVTLSRINLPSVGNPTMWIGNRAEARIRLLGSDRLEVCRLKNVQVKKVFWVSLDGAFIDVTAGAEKAFVDVSSGGSYPSC